MSDNPKFDIVAKYLYQDQHTITDKIVGIFDDYELALKCKKNGGGYIRLFKVRINSYPMELIEII